MSVIIYTDGGADFSPGNGGWAALLKFGDREKVLSGNATQTTNSRMELQGAIAALEALTRPVTIDFYIDSEYVRLGITQRIERWANNDWKQKNGKPVANVDLWQQLRTLAQKHDIAWHWVKGHAGDPLNERVDKLATEARMALSPQIVLAQDMPRLFVRASCKGNPGPGGWGVILEEGEDAEQLSGGEWKTTNNRMELMGVIEGVMRLSPGRELQLFTVSDYLYNGATNWIRNWRKRNWKKKGDAPIANADLWQIINQLMQNYTIHWVNAKKEQTGSHTTGLEEAAKLATHAAMNQ